MAHKFRAAIIGCGNIAGKYDETKKDAGVYSHAGAYQKNRDIELVAAADVDAKRLSSFAQRWRVKSIYKNVSELLMANPIDVLSVCVPDGYHAAVALKALSATRPPKVIFMEKPLALSRAQARQVLNAARKKKTLVVLNSQRRWDVGHQGVREMIRRGGLGKITTVNAYYVKGLYHIGTTAVNTIRFLVSEVKSVRALSQSAKASVPGDPSIDASLDLKNGAVATIRGVDRYGYSYSLFEIDILGTKGRVRLTENGDKIEISHVNEYSHYAGFQGLNPVRRTSIRSEMGNALPDGVADIVAYLKKSRRSVTQNEGEQGYLDLCVLDAIASSQKKGGALVKVVR